MEMEMDIDIQEKMTVNNASSHSSPAKFLRSCYQEHCTFLTPMLGWFVFSSSLSLYNKYVFGEEHMAFPCPLLMTSLHFLIQFLVSYGLSKKFPDALGGDQVDAMPWGIYLCVAIPCALVTSLDVGLSNLSLVRITLTFYTMVKSSSPIFVVISAYIFGIEKITPILIITVIIISAGELLTVLGEVKFDLIGFIYVLSAAVLSGMRWTVIQLKLQSLEPKLKSTIATMRILSPFMFLTMVLLSLVIEEPWNKFGSNNQSGISFFEGPKEILGTVGIGLLGGTLAICMISCELFLIMKTSAIILMIGGVVKELTTIILGVSVMGDKMNATNSLGVLVVFSGVMTYKVSHYLQKKEKVYDSVDMDSNGSFALDAEHSLTNGRRDGNGELHDGPFSLDYEFDDSNELEGNHNDNIIDRRRQKKSKSNQRPLVESEDVEII